jgi:hypothetical protein
MNDNGLARLFEAQDRKGSCERNVSEIEESQSRCKPRVGVCEQGVLQPHHLQGGEVWEPLPRLKSASEDRASGADGLIEPACA